jgi:cyclophilin family peptidyl-prolyl cis-trans isomerase
VTLHTTLGELKLEVFCEAVPKAAEVRARAATTAAARLRR